MSKVAGQLTYSRVVSTTALFLALGGGAYAFSLGKGDVTSRTIKNDSIGSVDVKRNALKGSDVVERTLKTAQFTAAASSGLTATGCTPPDDGLGPCAEVSLTVPVAGRVFATASGLKDANPASASGGCQLRIDGVAFAAADLGGMGAAAREQFSFSGVSQSASPGDHVVALACSGGGITGDLSYRVDSITAAVVGGK